MSSMFFFFQAEDGIRDYKVTGVQTCALPICRRLHAKWRRGSHTGSVIVITRIFARKFLPQNWREDHRVPRNAPVGVLLVKRAIKNICGGLDAGGARVQIGRAAWRGRGEISVGAGSLKKKKIIVCCG